jgi:hypothetical protein
MIKRRRDNKRWQTRYDELKTAELFKSSSPRSVDERNRTWLRQDADREAGLIDLYILEGKYSIGQMNDMLSGHPEFNKKSRSDWEKRILFHIRHLEQSSEMKSPSGQFGHNLKIQTSRQGVISFDY